MSKVFVVGRSSTCDYVLKDSYASKQHVQIIITKENIVYIVDLHSTSGTTINGHQIDSGNPIELKNYDIVRAANSLVPWKIFLNEKQEIQNTSDLVYDEYAKTLRKAFEGSSLNPAKKSRIKFFKRLLLFITFSNK